MKNIQIIWQKEEILKNIIDYCTVPVNSISYIFKRSIYDRTMDILTEKTFFPNGTIRTICKTTDGSTEFSEYDSAGEIITDSRTEFHNTHGSGIYSTTYESDETISQEIHEYNETGELSKQIFVSESEAMTIEYKREGNRKITRHYNNDVFQHSTEIEKIDNNIISTDYSKSGAISGRTVIHENCEYNITSYKQFGLDDRIISTKLYQYDDRARIICVSSIDQEGQINHMSCWTYDEAADLPECCLEKYFYNKKLIKEIKYTYSYEM